MHTVSTRLQATWHERAVGVADGFSREYTWNAANGHTQEMTNKDAELLRASLDVEEFDFDGTGGSAEPETPAPADEPAPPEGDAAVEEAG